VPSSFSKLVQNQGENELVFLKFKKTEISIDWTLVKLSFRDFQIFKEIANHNIELMKSRVE
jgi:hypothetical protein